MGISGQIPSEEYIKEWETKTGSWVNKGTASADEVIILENVPYFHQRQRLD